jgi:hypothetical protein
MASHFIDFKWHIFRSSNFDIFHEMTLFYYLAGRTFIIKIPMWHRFKYLFIMIQRNSMLIVLLFYTFKSKMEYAGDLNKLILYHTHVRNFLL